ncbi:hypothetical protein GCM10010923_24860 [Blastomonas marina]|uniref:Flagellar protein FlgJ N-terminal domain-containing protein n=1 Tax=Blastomonas marina TaxID=1867408 RepID=A0ABQ1FI42_9SPHN|nr:hypothetical protein GCM10010923_24860 [Blastomonas marina]
MIDPTAFSANLAAGTTATTDSATAARKEELRAAAEAFEAVFLRQMIGSMRSASLAEDIFGNQGTEQFRDMQDARMADAMADSTEFGIAELLLKQFEGRI